MKLQRFSEESGTGEYLRHIYCGHSFFLRYSSFKQRSCRRGRLEAIRAEGTNGGHAVDGGSR